jgi:superfamily I DNA/RNA helicase
VVNFPTRGIGARTIELLQNAAEQYGISLYAAVPYMTGKAGSSLGAFVKLIEGARFETQNLPLPEMVRVVLERSTLLTHYAGEKEGADRIENLEQMVDGLPRVFALDRARVRKQAVARFGVERMVREYAAVYQKIVEGHRAG